MSKFVKNIFLWIFIMMLSVSFIAYFGISGDPITQQGELLATVNNREIYNSRNSEFTENYRLLVETYQQQGIEVNDQISSYLAQQAFRQTILNQLIVEKARENHFEISDPLKLKNIIRFYFNNSLEEFNQYKATGDKSRQVEIDKRMTRRLLRNFYELSLFSSMPIPEKEAELMVRINSLQKKIIIASFDLEQELEKELDEKTLREYYQKNISRYPNLDNKSATPSNEASFLSISPSPNSSSNNDFFLAVRDKVLADYRLENDSSITDKMINDISFKLKSITNNGDQKIEKFIQVTEELGMERKVSDYFSYDSKTINDLNGDPLVNSPELIKDLFIIDLYEISEIYPSEGDLFVVIVIDEKRIPNQSNFVKKRYAEEVKQKSQSRAINNFNLTLYQNADIVTPQQQQN